jgi:uncharacterized protein
MKGRWRQDMVDLTKRQFLKKGLCGLSVCGVGAVWSKVLLGGFSKQQDFDLQVADENGVSLPAGFNSRIIARSSEPVIPGQAYTWHAAPDGGACFSRSNPDSDNGWIYVSNSEISLAGGAGAIVFDAAGKVIDAYPILENTNLNCAGGATPWGSWLSCEELDYGRVWECYPDGQTAAVVRPALGVFTHEAVAVDVANNQLYLTEDKPDGCLFRFSAETLNEDGFPDLSAGILEVAVKQDNQKALSWVAVPDPLAQRKETRYQVTSALNFDGGEGIAYYDGRIIFTTKGDNRVWSYRTSKQILDIVYDAADALTPILTGVDNITVSRSGDIYVAEDGGDLQIVVIGKHGNLYPIAQLEGHDQSEVTGIAFSPDGKRLYFSSQRGTTGRPENGITYEIIGF